jgi:hypothetical protein
MWRPPSDADDDLVKTTPKEAEMFDHQQMLSTMASQRRIALTASADRWRLLARFRSGRRG